MRYFNLGELSSYRACLMGVATIMILCCHASVWCTGLPSIIRSFLVLGNLGVDIFLFLSGFGLYFSLEHSNNGLCSWYAKRYNRVLIPYFIIVIPCYTIIALVNGDSFCMYLANISTLSYWLYHKGAWYVAMLIPLYFATPLLKKILSGRYQLLAFVLLVIASTVPAYCLLNVINIRDGFLYNLCFVLMRLPSFLFGLFIAPWIKKNKEIRYDLICAISVLLLFLSFIMQKRALPFELFMLIPITVVSIKVMSVNNKYIGEIRCFFAFMGSISLESYLYNILLPIILISINWDFIKVGINNGNYFIYSLTILIGVVLSYLTHRMTNRLISNKHKTNAF